MKQGYILKIDEPCKADWISMSKNNSGRYCSHCTKNVIDFTHLSDTEIIEIIEKASGKLCGRLDQQQLNKLILQKDAVTARPGFYKLFAGIFFLSTPYAIAESKLSIAPIIPNLVTNETTDHFPGIENEVSIPDTLKNIIQGRIIDSDTKEPLPFVNVTLKEKDIGATTDINGNFKIIIPDQFLSDNMIFRVAYVGYEPIEFVIDKKDLPQKKDLIIQTNTMILGRIDVIVVKRKWWQRKKGSHSK